MNGIQFFRHIPTEYQLNPSTVVFSQQPTSESICLNTGIATFVGIASLSPPENQTGSFSYQWHREVLDAYIPVSDGAYAGGTIAGAATTALTISNLTNDDDYGVKFKLLATFTPTGDTATPYDNPKFSDAASLGLFPNISITTQPEDVTGIINEAQTFTVVAEQSNPSSGTFSYQWTLNGNNLTDGNITDTFENSTRVTTISGSRTDTLSVTSTQPNTGIVSCIVSHSTACNSPIVSDEADFEIVNPNSIERSMLKWEVVRDDQAVLLESGSQNLFGNPKDFNSSIDDYRQTIVLYAPEKDMEVYLTMEGAAGAGYGSNTGGSGGKSIFGIVLKRNTEYVLRLGPALEPFGGRGGGGGAAFFYEKGQLLAVVGGGGGAGNGSNGGSGGGIGLAGNSGSGGSGAPLVTSGSLSVTGTSQNGRNGGRVESCTNGDFYQSQGISPCVDVGLVQFRTSDGTIIPDTATIQRGYKAGPSNRGNGGNSASVIGVTFVGGGGSGTTGGQATNTTSGSGGGGSGYTNGTVQAFETVPGANTTPFAKVNISLPFPIAPPITTENVSFSVSREAAFSNTITFRRQSGSGPNTITWGPNSGTVVASIQKGSVYVLQSNSGTLRLSGNTLQLEDSSDNDFNDLQVTPNKGRFTSTSRYEF